MRYNKLKVIVGYWNNTLGWVPIEEGLFLTAIGCYLVPVFCLSKEGQ